MDIEGASMQTDFKVIEFHVHVDASCISLGIVLTQEGAEGMDHWITFVIWQLSKAEKNYSTMVHSFTST